MPWLPIARPRARKRHDAERRAYLGADLGMVMGDGPRESGGRIEQTGTGNGIVPAAMRIAESLQSQHLVTYTIPDGTSTFDRIAVSTSRKGIKLTAPTRIAARLPDPARVP